MAMLEDLRSKEGTAATVSAKGQAIMGKVVWSFDDVIGSFHGKRKREKRARVFREKW